MKAERFAGHHEAREALVMRGGSLSISPPPRYRDELGDRLIEYREACEDSDRRACVRLGILIGENRERRAAWRREHPEAFFYER
jgi:hypothetical protein